MISLLILGAVGCTDTTTNQTTTTTEQTITDNERQDTELAYNESLEKQIKDEVRDIENLEVNYYDVTNHLDIRFTDNEISTLDIAKKQVLKNTAQILYVVSENPGNAQTVTISARTIDRGNVRKMFQGTATIAAVKSGNWETYREYTTSTIEEQFRTTFNEIYWDHSFNQG